MSDVSADEVLVAKTDLQAGALRLPEVLMQSVTLVAPAIATLFSFGFIVGSFAGLMAPFAFAIVLLIALMLAINLSMLARLFPSAGGYFTYISRAIHPRVGMFAGWLYFLINPLVPCAILVYMGTVLDNELQAKYDFNFPWWLFVILGIGVIMFVAYRGIQLSGRLLIILGSLEILIVVALSVWGASTPGPAASTSSRSIRPTSATSARTGSTSRWCSASSRSPAGRAPARSPRRARTRTTRCRRRSCSR